MEITELPPTPFVLPTARDLVHIPTQRWALEQWQGVDPPDLATPWSRKPKYSVNGNRSCAELVIVHHLRNDGRNGVCVNAFHGELRSQWFPVPAAKTLAAVGAPAWAISIFERLRAANGGTLSGLFDVFAWRHPGQVRFYEAKVGPDRIKPNQVRFVEVALRFHCLEDFLIVEVARPLPDTSACDAWSARDAAKRHVQRSVLGQHRTNGQGVLREAGKGLLDALDSVIEPDEPETRQLLRNVAAAIETRRKGWPSV